MADVPGTSSTQLMDNSANLAPMVNALERILCSASLSSRTASTNSNRSCDADGQVEILKQALEFDNEGLLSPTAREPEHQAS